jgi:hypothetical protein
MICVFICSSSCHSCGLNKRARPVGGRKTGEMVDHEARKAICRGASVHGNARGRYNVTRWQVGRQPSCDQLHCPSADGRGIFTCKRKDVCKCSLTKGAPGLKSNLVHDKGNGRWS